MPNKSVKGTLGNKTMRKLMKSFKYVNASLVFICVLSGCVPNYQTNYSYQPTYSEANKNEFYYADYDISLTKVDPPKKSAKPSPIIASELKFEDQKISITWLPRPTMFSFLLKNKLDHSMKVVWDETVFVDENGGNHKIMHSGIKFTDRGNSQSPTVIIKGGKLEDLIYPIDYASWRDGSYDYSSPGGWDEHTILPFTVYGGNIKKQKLTENANSYIGKTFQISLLLEDEGVVNEYLFTFQVNSVQIKNKK